MLRPILVSASLMCADFTNLRRDVAWLEEGGVEWLHFDVMDGHFVPNFTMGPDVIKNVRGITTMPFDVHLMVEHPIDYIDRFVSAGADIVCVHLESASCVHECVERIRLLGARPAVAIKPETPSECLLPIIQKIDMVLVMTVHPGFAGQKLLPETLDKISDVAAMRESGECEFYLQVDGNVSLVNIPKMVTRGADVLVCGTSSLFVPDKPLPEAIGRLNDLITSLQCIEG